MTIQLRSGTRPKGTVEQSFFCDHLFDRRYWGVPRNHFTIEDNKIYLDTEFAINLEWAIDEVAENTVNIAALPQEITANGELLRINPGFWCSWVDHSNIKSNPPR